MFCNDVLYYVLSSLQFDVGGYTHDYIVAQGPLESTTGEFWQMVWEQNTQIILMLTNEYVRTNYTQIILMLTNEYVRTNYTQIILMLTNEYVHTNYTQIILMLTDEYLCMYQLHPDNPHVN